MSEIDKKIKKQIQVWLKSQVSDKRYKHIENVAKTAKKYAKKLKLDHSKAELSAWLHDCAKEYPASKLLKIAKQKRIKLDEIDIETPHVLHARVGALIAKKKFKIKDSDVLGGIRCHTLAEPDMSELMMVVYLADASAPGRKRKFAEPLRKTFKEKGLGPAVLKAIDNKLQEVIKQKRKIHPLTIKARNWLVGEIKN